MADFVGYYLSIYSEKISFKLSEMILTKVPNCAYENKLTIQTCTSILDFSS